MDRAVLAQAIKESLADFYPGTKLATSSSRARHFYGRTYVLWENARWPEQKYLDRLERWRLLENATRQVPGLLKVDLTAEKLFQILTILTKTFTEGADPIRDLGGLSRLRFDAKTMLGLKLFAQRPLSNREMLSPIEELGALDQIVFFADRFQSLANDFHRLLPYSPELLFMPSPANPFRVRIKLAAEDPWVLVYRKEKFVAFYESLAANRLPGIFDVLGPMSLKDAFLGYFDREAFHERSEPIFPQYPRLEPPRSVEVESEKMLPLSLSNGNVGNLESLTERCSLLEHPIFLQPADAEWARFFLEHMTKEEIAHFALTLASDGEFACDLIRRPIKGLAEDLPDHQFDPSSRPDLSSKYRGLLALDATSTIAPNQQCLLKEYALELMQGILQDITVDEAVLTKFYSLKELLYIMTGSNNQIGRLEPELAARIVLSLELTVGQELPALRRTLPEDGLKLLEEATANDPEGAHRFDPTRALPGKTP